MAPLICRVINATGQGMPNIHITLDRLTGIIIVWTQELADYSDAFRTVSFDRRTARSIQLWGFENLTFLYRLKLVLSDSCSPEFTNEEGRRQSSLVQCPARYMVRKAERRSRKPNESNKPCRESCDANGEAVCTLFSLLDFRQLVMAHDCEPVAA